MGFILRFCLKILVIFLLKIQIVPAVPITWACTFFKDNSVKFSTHLNQGKSDTRGVGKYSSGLSIIDNGAELPGWQPVWCANQSSEDPRIDYTDPLPEGTTDPYLGYFNYAIASAGGSTTSLFLTNQSDTTQRLPFIICMGGAPNSLAGNCVDSIGKHASIPLGTAQEIREFNNAVLPLDDGWMNPNKDRFLFSWRVASYLRIAKGTNVPPGIYSGDVLLLMNVKFRAQKYFVIVKVDGDARLNSTYKVYIQKECRLSNSGDKLTQVKQTVMLNPIKFANAAFVKNLQPTSTHIGVRCTLNTPYTIRMTGKNDVNKDNNTHYLVNSNGYKIPYTLRDSSHIIWDYNKPTSYQGTGKIQNYEVQAAILPTSEVPPATYEDTITVEITF